MGKKIWRTALIIIGIGIVIRGIMMIAGDPIEKDLLDYINNHLLRLTKTQDRILDSYGAVTGANYKDDKILFTALHDTIIPEYSQFVDSLKSLKPKTTEVQKLHNQFISGAEIQLSGFQLAMQSIEKEDSTGIPKANEKLDEAKKIFSSYDSSLDSLAQKHDVEIEKKDKK